MLKIIIESKYYNNPLLPTIKTFYDNLYKYVRNYKVTVDRTIRYHTRDPTIINIKISYLPDYFYFDRMGYGPWSEMALGEYVLRPFDSNDFFNIVNPLIKSNQSKYQQKALGFFRWDRRRGPFIFFPLQTEGDEVLKAFKINFFGIVKDVLKYSQYPVVFKPHPKQRNGQIERYLISKKAIITYCSIHDVIPEAKAVLTINSGVGFEALMHLVPVITLGPSDYREFTVKIDDAKELCNIDRLIEKRKFDNYSIKQFVLNCMKHYWINAHDEQSFVRKFKEFGWL